MSDFIIFKMCISLLCAWFYLFSLFTKFSSSFDCFLLFNKKKFLYHLSTWFSILHCLQIVVKNQKLIVFDKRKFLLVLHLDMLTYFDIWQVVYPENSHKQKSCFLLLSLKMTIFKTPKNMTTSVCQMTFSDKTKRQSDIVRLSLFLARHSLWLLQIVS